MPAVCDYNWLTTQPGESVMEWGIFGLLVLIADIYAILKIVQSSASDGKKALWVAIVIVFPLIGVILWYLMGPGR
jgi:hypothetical protein